MKRNGQQLYEFHVRLSRDQNKIESLKKNAFKKIDIFLC